MPSGPEATSGGSVTERTYMNSQIGIRLSAAIAQNGIFGRDLAAATYGGSGLGGGGGAGAAAALRAAGPDGAAAASGVAAALVAGARCRCIPAGRGLALLTTTEAERGAAITRPLQQVFGDLVTVPPRYGAAATASGRAGGDLERPTAPLGHTHTAAPLSPSHLCTTSGNHDTDVPDCTSSQTCGATTVRANVHEGRGERMAR